MATIFSASALGGDEIAYNLVFSTCRESGDHGPFNSWDRQPFLTTVRTGEPSMRLGTMRMVGMLDLPVPSGYD